MHGTVDEEKRADEDRQHDVVEHPDIVQVEHGKKLSPRHRLNTVFAVSERRLQTEEVHHLREREGDHGEVDALATDRQQTREDRKSTRLNSSHEWISYAVFCLKKKKSEKH